MAIWKFQPCLAWIIVVRSIYVHDVKNPVTSSVEPNPLHKHQHGFRFSVDLAVIEVVPYKYVAPVHIINELGRFVN